MTHKIKLLSNMVTLYYMLAHAYNIAYIICMSIKMTGKGNIHEK